MKHERVLLYEREDPSPRRAMSVNTKIVRLGQHMPLSTRRMVYFCGETADFETAIGNVIGTADGAVLVRELDGGPGVTPSIEATVLELTPEQAKAAAKALTHAALAVEQWQEHASGFNRIRVTRTPDGAVTVTHQGRTRPMRLSKLRGSGRVPAGQPRAFYRSCGSCRQRVRELYVAADDLHEHGYRIEHVDVCPDCVEKLANLPETIAEVTPGARVASAARLGPRGRDPRVDVVS